ncbi:MAG: glycerophosphodiester phosphodiesterase [Desulfobacterales bacterium]
MRSLPWLIAHRGAMAEAPENVEAAFDLAFSYNIDGIEFDVQMTADGVPVIFHDETLRRITGGKKTIADSRIAELSKFDFGKWYSDDFCGQRLMTLETLLMRYSGRGILMIELKSGAGGQNPEKYRDRLCTEVVGLIDKHVGRHLLDEIFVLSFDAEMILKTRQSAPYLNYILNLKKAVIPGEKDIVGYKDLWGCCLARRRLTFDFAGQCREKGLHTAVYSCNTPAQVSGALELGVDVVMTDDPGRVAGPSGKGNVLSCEK